MTGISKQFGIMALVATGGRPGVGFLAILPPSRGSFIRRKGVNGPVGTTAKSLSVPLLAPSDQSNLLNLRSSLVTLPAKVGQEDGFMDQNDLTNQTEHAIEVGLPRNESLSKVDADPLGRESIAEWRRVALADAQSTVTINSMCDDLTERAADGIVKTIVGRDKEIDQVAIALQQKYKGGALVVGSPGVGKTALVEALASKIVSGELEGLKNHRLVSLPITHLVADTSLRGELEKKVKEVIKEAKNRPIILFIDEFHTIIGAGKAQGVSSDIADMLKSARGLKIVGCTTEKEFTEKIKSSDPAFLRRFELIKLMEPDRKMTKKILCSLVPELSDHHKVVYEDSAIDKTLSLASRFVAGHSPDKEITILDRTGAWARHQNITLIDADMIAAGVEQSTGIPLARIQSNDGHSPAEIAGALRNYIVGQQDAIETVTSAIFQARTGVNPNRPSVIVFSGPTGTGKTELAKAIAKVDGRHLIRIDMETVKNLSSLRGADPGYIGHEREGILTGPQKVHPYSLILFDEIEKAPDDVLKALLGLLDEGELTDSRGERVSFNNAMIIFTTNFGAQSKKNSGQFGFDLGIEEFDDRNRKKVETEKIKRRLGDRLGPEYINRFRNFIVFDELSEKNMEQIASLILRNISLEFEEAKNLKLSFHSRLISAIAHQGYDPQYGAREVRRICDHLIRSTVGHLLLEYSKLGKIDTPCELAFVLNEDGYLHVGIKGVEKEIIYREMMVSSDLRDVKRTQSDTN